MHLGVRADVFAARPADGRPAEDDCHHIILEDWARMEEPHGTLFVSLPSLLDPGLAPAGRHIVHAFTPDWIEAWQDLPPEEYEARKAARAAELVARLDKVWPGLAAAVEFTEVGTPRTHRRFLNREDGTYGPIPSRAPLGMLSMPFNRTSIAGLYCAGDSTFPGQGVNAVVFSGFGAAHRVAVDLGMEPGWPQLDKALNAFLGYVRDRS